MDDRDDLAPKVLIYRSKLLPYSETFIREQALALRGWRAVLIGETMVSDGLSLDELDVRLLFPENAPSWRRFVYPIRRQAMLPDHLVTAHLRKFRAQLVHAHFGTSAVDIWPYARALRLPLLITLHGFDINIRPEWWRAGKMGIRWRTYPDRLMRIARDPTVRFLAVSHAIRDRAIEYGIAADKVSVSYIGVDTNRFTPGVIPLNVRRKRILYVGRLVEKKGTIYLLNAFAKISARIDDAELVIAGDGPLRSELQSYASRLGLNNAIFKGALSSSAIKHEMDYARVLCLPSVTAGNGDAEGFGMVLLEAQAAGLPVVSSACGGSAEGVLEGITGFAFQEKDVDQMTEALIRVLTDDALAYQMGVAARRFIEEKFAIKNCTATLARQYSAALRAFLTVE